MSGASPDEPTPAERRLAEHLEVLRTQEQREESVAPRVVRTARWQKAARAPLRVVGMIFGAFTDALGVAARQGRRG